jgi:hypothetical protein
LLLALSMMMSSVHAIDNADFAKRVEFVRTGDAETRVRQLLEHEPDRMQRSTVLGVQRSLLEFDVGPNQYEFIFYAGHLVTKTVRSRKPSLLDKLPF